MPSPVIRVQSKIVKTLSSSVKIGAIEPIENPVSQEIVMELTPIDDFECPIRNQNPNFVKDFEDLDLTPTIERIYEHGSASLRQAFTFNSDSFVQKKSPLSFARKFSASSKRFGILNTPNRKIFDVSQTDITKSKLYQRRKRKFSSYQPKSSAEKIADFEEKLLMSR